MESVKQLNIKYKTRQTKYGTQYYPEITCPVCGKQYEYIETIKLRKCTQCGTAVSIRGE